MVRPKNVIEVSFKLSERSSRIHALFSESIVFIIETSANRGPDQVKAKESERTARIGVAIAMNAFESIGFAFREQTESDYGIDAHAELIQSECPTGQLLGIQLKSGASYFVEQDKKGYVFRIDKAHVEYWLNHALPVVICLCDIDTKTVYWQAVTMETAISTGKGYKFTIPDDQTIDSKSINSLENLLTPVVSTDRYTIFKTDDSSHAGAKRYSFEIVLNGTFTKSEIGSIVRQVTDEGVKRRYHRNHFVEGRWGDSDAHVVWTFIYPSAEDHHRHNHICRSIWIHDKLEAEFRPIGFSGENIGANIIVDWSKYYDFLSGHISDNTLSKEAYFYKVLPLIEDLTNALELLQKHLPQLKNGQIEESAFLKSTQVIRERIEQIFLEMSDMPFAPYECRDVDIKLESFIAYLDNIRLYFSESGREHWVEESRIEQSLDQLAYAQETLTHLKYELSKVR